MLHMIENSQSGSEDLSFHPFPLSKLCGSQELSMTSVVPQLFTESVQLTDFNFIYDFYYYKLLIIIS